MQLPLPFLDVPPTLRVRLTRRTTSVHSPKPDPDPTKALGPPTQPDRSPNHHPPLAFDPEAIHRELDALTRRYGVHVRLEYAGLRSRYGDQKKDRIRLSRYIATDAQALDTLRHEYAHAVAEIKHRSKAKHGPLWRTLAAEMGAAPRSRGRGELVGVPLLQPTCTACGRTHVPRARRLKRARCPACRSRRIVWAAMVGTRFAPNRGSPNA